MTPVPVEIAATDGCVLRGQVWPGGSDWTVLIHDVGPDEDLDRWRPLLPALLAERLSVLAVDLRGHGASDGEWQDAVAVDDVAATIRFVRERTAELVVVIAAGVSAVTALWVVEREYVDGVVVLSATEAAPTQTSPLPRSGRVPGTGNREPSGCGAVRWRSEVRAAPRAPATPKLFVVGAQDQPSRQTTADLHAASIGWALVVTLPTAEHGTELLAGALAGHVHEHILAFIRERLSMAHPTERRAGRSPAAADAFLAQLGIKMKGVEE